MTINFANTHMAARWLKNCFNMIKVCTGRHSHSDFWTG